ncbi:MAG: hypothetical protein O7C75_02495 [Verrucomicrobia bacterium]|nr:hypothetical protein [Verrucomicrobiota bacterium]
MDPKIGANFVLVFSALICLLSFYGILFPKKLIDWVTGFWDQSFAFYLAIIIRLIFGAALIIAAPVSKYETAFTFLGYLTIVAAVVIFFVGRKKIGMILIWAKTWPLLRVRAWLVFGVAFCGFLITSLI